MSQFVDGDDRDSAADTFRNYLNDHYPTDNAKPLIISPGGVLIADGYATPNDIQLRLTTDAAHIRLRNGDTEVLAESNQQTYIAETVYIDIIGKDAEAVHPRLEEIRKSIDKIIFETSNSQNPKMLDFAIAWIRLGENENVNNQISGEIRLSSQRCKA